MPVGCVQTSPPPFPSGKVGEGEFSLLLYVPLGPLFNVRRGGFCKQANMAAITGLFQIEK